MSIVFAVHRRDFLRHGFLGLAGATFLGMKLASSAGDSSAESEKGRRNFIDAHVHVWTNDFQKYPLAEGFTPQDMDPAAFFPDEIVRRAKPSGVNRFVLVQMSYYGFDNSYELHVIRLSPQLFRGIAVVDWKGSAPDAKMRELAKKGVRGFRIYSDGTSAATWLHSEGFDKMFRCGAEERLALCLLINPDALPAVDRQCRKFPNTPVIIDHLARIGMGGRVGMGSPIRQSDERALCALAKCPQVMVKLSAFYTLGEAKPPHVDLGPLIRRVYEAFGPKRLMWGSDCPWQLTNETYEDSISLVRDRLDFLSREDKEWILRRTTEEFFFR